MYEADTASKVLGSAHTRVHKPTFVAVAVPPDARVIHRYHAFRRVGQGISPQAEAV